MRLTLCHGRRTLLLRSLALQAFLKAADAMAEARRELVHGLVTAASDAFR